jgi:hypothetical protein
MQSSRVARHLIVKVEHSDLSESTQPPIQVFSLDADPNGPISTRSIIVIEIGKRAKSASISLSS